MSNEFEIYVKTTKEQWRSETEKLEKLPLWEDGKVPLFDLDSGLEEPSLIPYLIQTKIARGAVIVCAGGSYGWKEPLEAFDHAKWLNEIGIQSFVLDYRVAPYTTTHALMDIKRAVRYIRYHSGKLNVSPDHIAVMGFSAGGHLSAMLSEQFDTGDHDAIDAIDRMSSRPDAQILCYPGITFHTFDPEFLKTILGASYTEADVSRTSLHLNVIGNAPPIFFWGTENDFLFQDWLSFFGSVQKMRVSLTSHIYPNGEHGFGRERTHSIWKGWSSLCQEWLYDQGF